MAFGISLGAGQHCGLRHYRLDPVFITASWRFVRTSAIFADRP